MASDPSFYYAIFKKLQTATAWQYESEAGHTNLLEPFEVSGGFSLRSTDHPNGIFGSLSAFAPTFPDFMLQQGWMPLVPGNFVPAENPLWALLAESLKPPPLPATVTVNGQAWPVMPKPDFPDHDIAYATEWLSFNTGAHRLIDAFATWIANGKADETPKVPQLTTVALSQIPPAIPGLPDPGVGLFPVLFVASMGGDDGRRHGDGEPQDPGANHVPANYWATSQIYLTDAMGNLANPATLESGQEFYVAAKIGNNGNWATGRSAYSQPTKIFVQAAAFGFNSSFSPGTLLPSLHDLDPQGANVNYEQYLLRKKSYDVVGFRFNVDTVFKNLTKAMTDQGLGPAQLGGLEIDAWLKASHACVKVMIVAGEPVPLYPPAGGASLTFESDPSKDRHIAQKNLMPFDMTVSGAKKIKWANFIVAQAGTGANALTLTHRLPADGFRFHIAVPTGAYERYVKPKNGALKGWEVARDVASKPFADAVILRQTTAGAPLPVAAHAKERFFGMSLGLEWEPKKIRTSKLGDVAVAQSTREGVVGGFSLRLRVTK